MPSSSDPLSLRELVDMQFTEDPSLIGEGLLPDNGLMFLIGPPKTYKSFIMGSIAAHLACGTHLFRATRHEHGRESIALPITRPCTVLVLEQEIGWHDLQYRYGRMHHHATPEHKSAMASGIFFASCDRDLRLDTDVGLGKMAALIDSCQPDVLCLDPLIKFHAADENSAQEMSAVFRNLDRLRDKFKLAVIVNHHARRESGLGPPAEGGRGSTAIFAEGDSFLQISAINRNAGLLLVTPIIRRGKPLKKFIVQLDFDTLGVKFIRWGKPKKGEKLVTHDPDDED